MSAEARKPCPSCAHGEWDKFINGHNTQCGIWGRDGYGRPRYLIEPEFTVRVDNSLGLLAVLLEPTTVVAKAWEQIERIGSRAYFAPRRALVTGAGPIGLMAIGVVPTMARTRRSSSPSASGKLRTMAAPCRSR